MTAILQIAVVATGLAALLGYGFWRDKKEHAPTVKDERQEEIPFPDYPSQSHDHEHRGAAMSRL